MPGLTQMQTMGTATQAHGSTPKVNALAMLLLRDATRSVGDDSKHLPGPHTCGTRQLWHGQQPFIVTL